MDLSREARIMIARPMAQWRPVSRRRGITIIETLVLITGVAAMLGLCVLLLQLLLRLDSQSRARLDGATAIARLARQFRQDVHTGRDARQVEAPSRPVSLRIETGPDRSIGYEVKGGTTVVRIETGKGTQVRRETYEIPRTGSIQLAVKQLGGRPFASLTVDRPVSKNPTDPPRLYEVLALVGKNRDQLAGAAPAAGVKP
jgi:hypothetical protein